MFQIEKVQGWGLSLIMVMALVLPAFPALARDRSLLNNALKDSMNDRDVVQSSFQKKETARRKLQKPAKENKGRIKIEVGDSFASVGGGGGSDDGLSFRDNSRQSEETSATLESEVDEVNRAVAAELAPVDE